MERVILWILAGGAALGGLDLLLGNRFKLGERFEEGFQLLGPTALSMAGILCLAPLLSGALERTVAPLWLRLGLDPAMLGGILAIDMGGYQMAAALAADAAVGRYAGILADWQCFRRRCWLAVCAAAWPFCRCWFRRYRYCCWPFC